MPAATLRAVLEDFCTRDGTDYGRTELTLEQKVDLLAAQLASGGACLVFDAVSETLGVVLKSELPAG